MQPASSPPTAGFDPVRLIQDHQAGVWRYLRALGCEAALADDITQETFLSVLQKPFQDMGVPAAAAYLRKIAYSLYVNQHRRNGRVIAVENLEEIAQTWERLAPDDNGEAMLAALKECMAALTERARRALEMRFGEKHSREEIAAYLAITEHGAKNLMQRAKQQLKSCVENKVAHES